MFGHKRIPSREGGVEIVVEELSTRMAALGHRVICYNRRGHHVSGAEFDGNSLSEYKGVQIKTVWTLDKKGLAALISGFLSAVRSALSQADVVHIHAEGSAFFSFIPKWFGKRVVCTVHGLDWTSPKWKGGFASKFIRQGERNAVRFADEIIVLGKTTQKYFMDTYGRKTRFIPNGVTRPIPVQPQLIQEKYGLEGQDYILYLGRIVPGKGIEYLIEAFKQTETTKKLVIAGGASDTDSFLRSIHAMAEGDERILFTGFVQGQLLEELYSNAYLYTLPSDLEGMPLSLLEAMSYGNCCLVSDIPECTDVVEDKGYVFHRADIADLRAKMQYLCDNSAAVEECKAQAANFICDKYNWDSVVDQTLLLYKAEN